MGRFIGIDTSCYTTSVAIYDSSAGLIAEERIVLSVKQGDRGLSQSNMVFQHTKNLPVILHKLSPLLTNIEGIGVSSFPRRRADSYMPAFLVGKGLAFNLSSALHVPVYEFSHQENHALAAIRNYPFLWKKPFYMMHLSGGTQDILNCTWNNEGITFEPLLQSQDITAGQLIDRIGVSLGLKFPCGQMLERLAEQGKHNYHIPVASVKGKFSFAGPETRIQKDIKSGRYSKEDIAEGVLAHIGMALERELSRYLFKEGYPFILVGGVMSNRYLRNIVTEVVTRKGLIPYLADITYSSDNSSGNAFGAYMKSTEK